MRHGEKVGMEKYNSYCKKQEKTSPFGYSKSSQNYFELLDNELEKNNISTNNTQYHLKHGEKRLITKNNDVYFLDYFIPEYNIAIEYFGNYWHMNPEICSPGDYNKHVKEYAKNIWKNDKNRIEDIYNEFGIKTFIVWESTASTTPNSLVNIILEYIKNLNTNQNTYEEYR